MGLRFESLRQKWNNHDRRHVLLFWAALLAFFFANLTLVEFWKGWWWERIGKHVALEVDVPGSVRLDSLTFTVFARRGNAVIIPRGKERWVVNGMLVNGLRLALPIDLESKILGVRLYIGDQLFDFSRERLLREWRRTVQDSSVALYDSPASLGGGRSVIPFLRSVLNWPGDTTVLVQVLRSAGWKFVLCLLLVLLSVGTIPLSPLSKSSSSLTPPLGRVLLLCLLFAVFYGISYLGGVKFDDVANPRGDAWEYQSMAVNAAKGYGMNRLGGIESFETYKFQSDERDTLNYPQLMAKYGGVFWSYRTPGYSAFLAGVYSIFGVSPSRAKEVQLLLLVIVSAFLPFVGFWYWKSTGFYGGIFGGLLFLESWYEVAGRLYTECVIVLTIFVFILGVILYQRRRTIPTVALLGFISGLALLIKGDLVFLPPLTLLLLAYEAWKKKISVLHPCVFAVMCLVAVAPWSVYASRQAGQVVVLSTQGSEVLLDGNNELVWQDGRWHPEYRRIPIRTSFYFRDDVKDLSTLRKIVRFYATYPEKLPAVLSSKLTAGFGNFLYIRLAVFLILLELLGRMLNPLARRLDPGKGGGFKYAVPGYGLLTAVLVLAVASISVMLLVLCCVLAVAGFKGALHAFSFPFSFVAVTGNFVLITMIAFGDPRFVSAIDFVFMMTAMTLVVSLLLQWFFRESRGTVLYRST